MTGPNSGPGHNSLLVYVEGQLDYAVQGITTILDDEPALSRRARATCSGATTSASRSG